MIKADDETYQIIGAAMRVHKELGNGFLEAVYGDALEIEFTARNIPYEREKKIGITYKDKPIKTPYYADFLCFGDIIIELKCVEALLPVHLAQVIHYLKATKLTRGLLLNFKNQSLEIKRVVL